MLLCPPLLVPPQGNGALAWCLCEETGPVQILVGWESAELVLLRPVLSWRIQDPALGTGRSKQHLHRPLF